MTWTGVAEKPALYRLDPPLFHVKHPVGRAEKPEVGVQRGQYELAFQPLDLLNESHQVFVVQLGRRVIQQECRLRPGHVLQQGDL
jgi:hypothetical protein